MEAQEPVVVYTVVSPAEAEIVRNLLKSEGIACEIGGESQAGLAGILEITLLTKAVDADRARKIIELHHRPTRE